MFKMRELIDFLENEYKNYIMLNASNFNIWAISTFEDIQKYFKILYKYLKALIVKFRSLFSDSSIFKSLKFQRSVVNWYVSLRMITN